MATPFLLLPSSASFGVVVVAVVVVVGPVADTFENEGRCAPVVVVAVVVVVVEVSFKLSSFSLFSSLCPFCLDSTAAVGVGVVGTGVGDGVVVVEQTNSMHIFFGSVSSATSPNSRHPISCFRFKSGDILCRGEVGGLVACMPIVSH